MKKLITRIANALDRLAPPPKPINIDGSVDALVWQPENFHLKTVTCVNRLNIDQLVGIDLPRDTLLLNTRQFAEGFPANNALLWGARGMGKSSLVKAIHGKVAAEYGGALVLVEIHREDLSSLPTLLDILKKNTRRYILFCDDLSFDANDSTYKSLKALLEGGLEGRPENVLFYATSNRRHLMPRDMIENEGSTGINPGESVHEKVSLSDRFGLWLGFYNCNQETYLKIIDQYVTHYRLEIDQDALRAQAIEWAVTRGARSGRVAWQFIQDLAGKQKRTLS
ncbi:MAG: ATP-binding protein [Pseudomonadota bacterium]|nr:ATP-binding protein [Pseudomonadota bacterium]